MTEFGGNVSLASTYDPWGTSFPTTRINSASASHGGSGDSTKVSIQALAKATAALNGLAFDCPTVGGRADDATESAAKGLSGWDTAPALRDTLREWHEQLSALTQRLHQGAASLEATHSNYAATEAAVAAGFRVG